MQNNCTMAVMQSQPDWVSVTAKTTLLNTSLQSLGSMLVAQSIAEGNYEREFHWRGYHGTTARHVSWGVRPDGTLLQISGPMAADHWRDAVSVADHVTRLDLQVTAHVDPPTSSLAADLYRDSLAGSGGPGRPVRTYLYVNSDGGATFYLGSPSSAQRGRVYNKEKESENELYADCWRWEVQFRDPPAGPVADDLRRSGATYQRCGSYVREWFARRGAEPGWQSSAVVLPRPGNRAKTDTARSLRWLAREVRPSVDRLRERGLEAAALKALGLDQLFDNPSDVG